MSTVKNSEPIVLIIIVTSVLAYHIIKGKKFTYLGHHWRHHIITPSMKALRIKSILSRELKKSIGQ